MIESLIQEVDRLYPNQALLTIEEVCAFLACEKRVVYNWAKRSDSKRRPPRILVGREVRFPKKEFFRWLAQEQSDGGSEAGGQD